MTTLFYVDVNAQTTASSLVRRILSSGLWPTMKSLGAKLTTCSPKSYTTIFLKTSVLFMPSTSTCKYCVYNVAGILH